MRNSVLFAALLLASSPLVAHADDSAPSTTDTYDENQNPGQGASGMESSLYTPTMTLDRIHAINLQEIDAGKLAVQNGTHAIRGYAQKLVKDHEKADSMVKATAQGRGSTFARPTR